MTANISPVKSRSYAVLKNVAACVVLVTRLINRDEGLPGIGVMYGPSGYGKTRASLFARNRLRAVYVEAGESWNKKTLLQSILLEFGDPAPRGTVASLTRQAIIRLGEDITRPLIIDEADKLVDKGMIELVRELFEHSQAPILLIGEELLPKKLQQVERVHNRVLAWLPAQPLDLEDARELAKLRLERDGVSVEDGLLARMLEMGEGRARRLDVSLSTLREWVRTTGIKQVTLAGYTGDICTQQPPQRARRA